MPVATLPRHHEWEVSPLCEGGFGQIYVTRHPKEGKLLIMKVTEIPLDKDAMWVPRMEYEALKRVQKCPNANHHVVEQPDLGRDNMWWSEEHARIFLLFNYYPRNLEQLWKEKGDLAREPAHLQTIIYDVVCGLDYLHSIKIIHKDIKPENIFVDRHGMYKIGDLGGALVYGLYDPSVRPPASMEVPDLTTNDPGVRSYNYSAPETVIPIPERGPDGRDLWTFNDSIDFWSLGMLIYEMVVGYVLPWCQYVADGPDTILISPKQIPHIMKHVLKSHSCDPEIFSFIMKACHPKGAARLRRERAMAIVEDWPPYTDPFANRFSIADPTFAPRPTTGVSLPNFMLGKDNLKQINENRIKAQQFKHLLKSARVDIPERSGYRYRRSDILP